MVEDVDRTSAHEAVIEGYRPVSPRAVATAILGFLSAASLFHPSFWVLPIVAVALGCSALADIGRSGTLKAGRPLAIAGIAMAVAFFFQAASQRAVTDWATTTRARAAAGEFVRAVREGRLTDARNMCRSPKEPPAIDEAAAARDFSLEPAVAALAACGPVGEPVLSADQEKAEGPWEFCFRVAVPCPGDGRSGEESLVVEVVVERVEALGTGGSLDRWRVVRHRLAGSKAAARTIP